MPAPPPPRYFVSYRPTEVATTWDLHRIHPVARDGNGFNPGLGRSTRFAPLRCDDGTWIPTAYAATTLESAAFETIFHDVMPDSRDKVVPLAVVQALSHSILRPKRPLRLISLHEPDLNHWGFTRRDLIDTPESEYGRTARWALHLHAEFADADGLIWTSRRCDPERALLLFGDRVHPFHLQVIDTRPVQSAPDLLADLRGFGRRAGITLV